MEVRSEPPFSVGLHNKSPPIQSPTTMQNMRLTFASDGTSIYKHVPSSSPPYQNSGVTAPAGPPDSAPQPVLHHGLGGSPGQAPAKRKRGRPRKYGPDGTMNLSSPPPVGAVQSGGGAGFPSPVGATSPAGQPVQSELAGAAGVVKKARGRPPGSGKKQQMNALGSAGTGFIPHVLTVKAGEDVSSVVMSFLQHGSRAVCILSANGAISNVTLRQAATSGGTVTYEGRFEILSLSGSFLFSETGGQRSRTGGLSVSLAGPDGRVLGGGVAGVLTAASPVQVVVGSFIAEGKKEAKETNVPETAFSPRPLPASNAGASSPPSRGTLSESSGGPSSPPHQSAGYNNGNQRPMPSMLSWK